jgi:hypothetical protein
MSAAMRRTGNLLWAAECRRSVHGRWNSAALRDFSPVHVRIGSKPVKLRTSKCFPICPRKGPPICALMSTRPSSDQIEGPNQKIGIVAAAAFATNARGVARLRRIETRYDRSFAAVGFFLADFIGLGPKFGPNGRDAGCYGTSQDQSNPSDKPPKSGHNPTGAH